MNISYKINNNSIIQTAFIPYKPFQINLVTGVENQSFGLVGGLIAKLFPVKATKGIAVLQSIMQTYTGELLVEHGELPQSATYVGVDPDRHLLFSTVKEELISQQISLEEASNILATVGLEESFLVREISSLSGGEKMKVVLAIAFSTNVDCYILHGVIPWLDKNGRDLLKSHVQNLRNKGACVIFFEHEVHSLENFVDGVYEFDGITIKESNIFKKTSFNELNSQLVESAITLSNCIRSLTDSQNILQFKNVVLKKHPLNDWNSENVLLNNITFNFKDNEIYFLIGDNGTGKSTLAQIAFRVFTPDSGIVSFCNKPITKYKREELVEKICYVTQFPEHQIVLSTIGEYRKQSLSRNNSLSLMLFKKYLDLPDSVPIGSLTYFQMKVLNLISFISEATKLIILDEPSWGLDTNNQIELLNILVDISKTIRFTLLIITHDFCFMKPLCPKVFWLHEGILTIYDNINDFCKEDKIVSKFDIPNNWR
ncbi:MAG: ATP-binding cassette domain-containing protein [Candidatus Marinimicrobia bacterium]|nr:ATP-binding cassette domain-containing protein [Candidatus Neomarinimicrobiota bacterium]